MKRYLKYIVLVLAFFLTCKINVFAYDNYSTTYTTNYDTHYFDDFIYTDSNYDINLLSYYDYLISLDSPYYDLFIVFNKSYSNWQSIFYLIKKGKTEINTSLFGNYNTQNTYGSVFYAFNIDTQFYTYSFATQTDFQILSTRHNNLVNCYLYNNCSGYDSYDSNRIKNTSFNLNPQSTINNSTSYNYIYLPDKSTNRYFVPFYSSLPLKITNDFTLQSGDYYYTPVPYYKTFVVNGVEYGLNDNFELFYNAISITESDEEFSNLNDLYFNFDKSDIGKFSYEFSFIPYGIQNSTSLDTLQTYFNSFYSNYRVYGRKFLTNTSIMYDKLDCSIDFTNSITNNSILSVADNLICTSNLSDYDTIHVYIDYGYNQDLNTQIYNSSFKYNSSLNYKYGNHDGYIYDKIDGFGSRFKLLFSSQSFDSVEIYSNNNNLLARAYSNPDNTYLSTIYQDTLPFYLSYGYDRGYNYLIYNDFEKYSGLTDLEYFIGENSFISFSLTYDDNDFDYIDNQGNIQNITIVPNYNIKNTDSYDLSYYFRQVDNYINDFQSELITFSGLIQNVYDGFPSMLKTFIFIVFIIICIYFTYLMIRK